MPATGRRRLLPTWVLFTAFVVMPLAELFVLIQVGQVIGAWWTIGLLVLASILGTWLLKREGGRAWRAVREALGSGRVPTKELADGTLVVLGGAMLLAPGFLSDVFGVLLVLPPTRAVVRRLVLPLVASRVTVTGIGGRASGFGPGFGPGFGSASGPGNADRPGPDVVRGDVVDED